MAVASEVLDLCDGLLGEPGRRRHVFSWLRGPDGWLPVDAYYPARRLVVLCRASLESELPDRQLVAAQGLRLLELPLSDLPDGRAEINAVLERLIADAGPSPRRLEKTLAPTLAPAPRPVPSPTITAEHTTQFGAVLGGLLLALVLIEAYLGVLKLGIDGGHLLLGFALALDGCARALGAIASERAANRDWAILCALGGSPFVAAFALFQPNGPVKVDPAPLAGLLSVLAACLALVALITAALGA